MVAPKPEEIGKRVRAVRDSEGKFIGFQDPDRGNVFISRQDAIPRLHYEAERKRIEDTFGNEVGVGALGVPGRGVSVAFKVKEATYKPAPVAPEQITPGPNQEIVERTIFVDQDGKLISVETSYGLGEKYDPSRFGGRWRKAASEALGAEPGKRLPTRRLKDAVASQEFLIKTISG